MTISAATRKENCTASSDDRIETLEKTVTVLTGELSKLRKIANKHTALLVLVDEHKATKTLDKIDSRVNELASMLQVEILKQTVCSEVSRHYPEVWPMVVRALDRANDWWLEGDALTVTDWRDRLVKERHAS